MLNLRLKFFTPSGAAKNVAAALSPFLNDATKFSRFSKSSRWSSTHPPKAPNQWKIFSAICLERLPVIAPPMKPIEKKMSELFHKMDIVKSLKSDHELRQDEDHKRAAKLSEGAQLDDTDPDAATRQTAQDFEDACNDEFSRFKPAPDETEADQKNDRMSIERKLNRHLVLVVKNNNGDKTSWTLPETEWKEGESLRDTAERVLSDVGKIPDSSVRILGNAPWGVYTRKFSVFQRKTQGCVGAKIFFYKAQLKEQKWSCNFPDFLWLGRDELKDYLTSDYLHSVQKFLIDED